MDKKELTDHCKQIAETFEMFAADKVMRCPECNDIFDSDELYDENDDETSRCPLCGAHFEDEWLENGWVEQLSAIDYLDGVLDVQVTRSGLDVHGPIVGVRMLVAFGGPNIWVDTREGLVKLFWWSDRAEYEISNDACDAFNDAIECITY